MASSSSAHPSASEAEEPQSPQLQDQTGWEPIPTTTNDWELRLDPEAAVAHPWRAAAAATAARAVREVDEEEEEDRRPVPTLGDPRRAAVAAAAVRLMRDVPPYQEPSRAEQEARAELDKRLSDVTPRPHNDDARFIAATKKIVERLPMLDSDLDLTCSCCGEDLDGRTMLLRVLELPDELQTRRLMTAATKWMDDHPPSSSS